MNQPHAVGCLALVAACSATPVDRKHVDRKHVDEQPRTSPAAASSSAASSEPQALRETQTIALVTDPGTLVALEGGGFDIAARAFDGVGATAKALYALPRYRALADTLTSDVRDVQRGDRRAGVGMQKPHRLFDATWLKSSHTRFELIGVVNRVDRFPFDGNEQRCGEVRLVYRLAYRTEAGGHVVDSRLPMTVNVVAWQPGACAEVAKRWRAPKDLGGAALATWMTTKGPLAKSHGWALKSVEVNFQSVRWPSAVHPSMAGHAEYFLRVFVVDGQRLVPAPMENQPDVARITRSPALKREVLAWVESNLAAIDAGTAKLPVHLLAKRARSVAPRGLARLANRPFRSLLRPSDFDGVSLSQHPQLESAEELIRRLDAMSCAGCHQSRSMAGFHLLGEERSQDKRVDALALSMSAHMQQDLVHRRVAIESLSDGGAGDRPRLTSERTVSGAWGAHCGLTAAAFSTWTCDEGLTCQPALGEPLVGMCLDPARVQVGAPCESGTVTQTADPHKDRVGNVVKRVCEGGPCERNRVGFPAGMCAASCGDARDETTCGAIALLTDFNDCLAQGRRFDGCIVNNSRPAGLRRCDLDARCRDDYVCAKTGSGEGACMPPYFLFQLRVDGHPL